MTTVGLIVAGAVSTGGLATLALRVSRKKSASTEIIANSSERSDEDVN
jgi:hypothetical protein